MQCYVCVEEIEFQLMVGKKTDRGYPIELEYHCIGCGFYRILDLNDYYDSYSAIQKAEVFA